MKLLTFAVTFLALTPLARADGPDWPMPKGQAAVVGKVVRFEPAKGIVTVAVEFELAPWSGHPGVAEIRHGTARDPKNGGFVWTGKFLKKEIPIAISDAWFATTVPHKTSIGIVTAISLKRTTHETSRLKSGMYISVYYQAKRTKTPLRAVTVVLDAP